MTGFGVDPGQLRDHAAGIAGYADRLAAIGARLPDGLSGQPLGSFGQFLTTGLAGGMTATLDAFAHAASTVDQVSGGMRQAAESYQRTDDDSAAVLSGIEAGEGTR